MNWKLAAPSMPGDATVDLDSGLSPTLGQWNGYLIIDPYTVEAELRRVKTNAGAHLTLDRPLTYAHQAADNVIWWDGGLIPWNLWGAKAGSTSYAADNVLAFNRLAKAQYDLGGGSNVGSTGVQIPAGAWYVNPVFEIPCATRRSEATGRRQASSTRPPISRSTRQARSLSSTRNATATRSATRR